MLRKVESGIDMSRGERAAASPREVDRGLDTTYSEVHGRTTTHVTVVAEG